MKRESLKRSIQTGQVTVEGTQPQTEHRIVGQNYGMRKNPLAKNQKGNGIISNEQNPQRKAIYFGLVQEGMAIRKLFMISVQRVTPVKL